MILFRLEVRWFLLLFICMNEANGEYLEGRIEMPGIRPQGECYVCHAVKLEDRDIYFTGFKADTTEDRVHHLIVLGVDKPGSTHEYWNCNGDRLGIEGLPTGPQGVKLRRMMYLWALNAGGFQLPRDTGFHVGHSTPIKYLVLQIHYAGNPLFDGTHPDYTGVNYNYTYSRQPQIAGIHKTVAGMTLPPLRTEYVEAACKLTENKEIHPFAFRTHAHDLGVAMSGYKVTMLSNGEHQWTLIGKKDPQLPQAFYPADNEVTLRRNDFVAVRCTMKNVRNVTVRSGMHHVDEMCNYYFMYWVSAGEGLLENAACYSKGPPSYYWHTEGSLTNIPTSASTVVGADGNEHSYPRTVE